MKYCNYRDVTSVYSLNSRKLPGRFSYGLGTRLYSCILCLHRIFPLLLLFSPTSLSSPSLPPHLPLPSLLTYSSSPSYHPLLLSPFSPQPSRSLYVIVRVIDRGVSLSSPPFLPSSFRIQCHWLQSTSLENTSELCRKMLKPLTRWELILTTNTLADTLACAVIGVTLRS